MKLSDTADQQFLCATDTFESSMSGFFKVF